ncbi:hypothetical protein JS55_04080 [Rickettsia felis str. LSU]|nr:hypothetical protein JS55_04080 [Rickettsia felis str. LSU]KHO03625.1 hypothetical protein JS61_04045 [Rickettsia felis]
MQQDRLDHVVTQWVLPVHATMPCEEITKQSSKKMLILAFFINFSGLPHELKFARNDDINSF